MQVSGGESPRTGGSKRQNAEGERNLEGNIVMFYPIIRSHKDPLHLHSNILTKFLIKIDDVEAISSFESLMKNPRNYLPKEGVNVNYILSNSYGGSDLMFLFKEDLSLTATRLSFNFFY